MLYKYCHIGWLSVKLVFLNLGLTNTTTLQIKCCAPSITHRFYKDITGESKKSYIITVNLSRFIVKIDTSEYVTIMIIICVYFFLLLTPLEIRKYIVVTKLPQVKI